MAKVADEPTSTMTLVLTLDQIAYIHKTASARGESLSKVGRELIQSGMTVAGGCGDSERCEIIAIEPNDAVTA